MFRLLYLSLLAAALAAAPPGPQLPRPDYLGVAAAALPALDAAFTRASCAPEKAKTPCNAAAELAAAHAALWAARGAAPSASEAARASELLLWFVGSWATATANGSLPNPDRYDFFACEPIAFAFRGLLRLPGGLAALGWAPTDAANARAAAADVCGPEMRGMWNQAMSRSSGTAIAISAWPELDANGTWSAYARGVLSDWTSAHAYAENSPVYNSIAFLELFTLALELDGAAADADVASPATQQMGAAFRSLMGPGAFIPAYGDAWSGAGTGAATWAWEEALYWPASFERLASGAAAAGDAEGAAEFAWAAAAYFYFGAGSLAAPANLCDAAAPPPRPGAVSSRALRYVLNAEVWRARGGGRGFAASAPPVAAAVTQRRLPPAGALAPDKLLLTAQLSPGGSVPYAAAELLSTSALYHAHVLQLGAVTYFAARNTTFLHGSGRDNYLAEMSSTVVLWRDVARPGPFPFPDAAAAIRPGKWALLELPAANLQPVSQAPEDYFAKNLSHLHFFVRNALPEPIAIDLAYIALANPDTGAELVIDDFLTLPWRAWPNGTVMADPAAPGPTHRFLRLACAPGKSTNSRPPSDPPLALSFDARDYPLLRLYWRASANAPTNDTGLLVIGHGPYTVPEGDFNPDTPLEGSNYDFGAGGIGDGAQYAQAPGFAPAAAPFFPHFASLLEPGSATAAHTPAGDAFGAYTIQRHYSSGVAWRRALVLTAEGALVAFDSLRVARGDAAEGWLGGPSWLLQALEPGAPVAAAAFDFGGFNATGCFGAGQEAVSPQRLLVALFAPQAGGAAVAGTQRGAFDGRVLAEAAFVHAPLSAAQPSVFVSVLLPHTSGAAPLAARASARRAGNATVAIVPLEGGGAATVTVDDAGGAWAVVRS